MMRLLVMLLGMVALGQDYSKWVVSESYTIDCSMHAANIICAYDVQMKNFVKVREIYAYITAHTAGTMTVRLSVQADNNGVPSGVDLAYVDLTPSAGSTWLGGQLNMDVELLPGQRYWQVARYVAYSSGSISIGTVQQVFISSNHTSRAVYRRYDGSTWSLSTMSAGMMMVDAHGWPVDPVPVVQEPSNVANYIITCRADRPMEIVGLVEWVGDDIQTASYTVTAQSGTGSGYVPASYTGWGLTFSYVWLNQSVKVGAGQPYTIQRTTPYSYTKVPVTTGLPTRLQNYFAPLCSGATVMVWPIERPLRVVR